MSFLRHLLVLQFLVISVPGFSQTFTKPSELKQFKITVNHEEYTIKTEILASPKNIKVDNEKVYMWYTAQKIMETKGGYDGKLIHGKYSSYYLNNQLKEQGVIKYGLKNKEWKYWYPDGKLREVINWKNGVKNGSYLLYNDLGQLMAKGNFCNDKLHGKFWTYGAGGKVIDKKKYKNGDEVLPKIKAKKTKPEKGRNTKTETDSSNKKAKKSLKKEKHEKKQLFKRKHKKEDAKPAEATI